jgi:HlyD family secretion protein
MKVNIKVHESHVNMIQPGLPAYVVLDSIPDQRFTAVVEKVAPLPDTQTRFGNPNLKVYNTEIYLTEAIANVKPGVSAKAEIIITNIANTLSVPIQAVTTYKGKQVVYVLHGSSAEPRPVIAGMYNSKFIEISQGLKEDERVLLSPPFEVQEKDLEGAILADEERSKIARTNLPPQAASRNREDRRANGEANGEDRPRQIDLNGNHDSDDHDGAREPASGGRTNRNERRQGDGMERPDVPQGSNMDRPGTGRTP